MLQNVTICFLKKDENVSLLVWPRTKKKVELFTWWGLLTCVYKRGVPGNQRWVSNYAKGCIDPLFDNEWTSRDFMNGWWRSWMINLSTLRETPLWQKTMKNLAFYWWTSLFVLSKTLSVNIFKELNFLSAIFLFRHEIGIIIE